MSHACYARNEKPEERRPALATVHVQATTRFFVFLKLGRITRMFIVAESFFSRKSQRSIEKDKEIKIAANILQRATSRFPVRDCVRAHTYFKRFQRLLELAWPVL